MCVFVHVCIYLFTFFFFFFFFFLHLQILCESVSENNLSERSNVVYLIFLNSHFSK